MKAALIFLAIVAIMLTAKHFQLIATLPAVGSLCVAAAIFAAVIIIRILSK